MLAYFSAVANINNYECFFFGFIFLFSFLSQFLHQTMGNRGRVSGRKKVCPLYIIISCNKTTNVCSGKFSADIYFCFFCFFCLFHKNNSFFAILVSDFSLGFIIFLFLLFFCCCLGFFFIIFIYFLCVSEVNSSLNIHIMFTYIET